MLLKGVTLHSPKQRSVMNNTSSPLEMLSAFAITFVAGGLSVLLFSAYGRWKQSQGASATTGDSK